MITSGNFLEYEFEKGFPITKCLYSVSKNVLWRHKKSDAEAVGAADELLYRCGLIGRWGLCAGFPEQNTLFNVFSYQLVWECNKGIIIFFFCIISL